MSARPGLCGGRRETGVPTAIAKLPSRCSKLHNHKKRIPSTDHHYIDQGLAVPGL
jgi:hypothetical protein